MNPSSTVEVSGTHKLLLSRGRPIFNILCRILMAGTFGVSGAQKVANPGAFQHVLQAYGFAHGFIGFCIVAVPFVEIALAILILFGVGMSWSTIAGGTVMLAYTVLIGISLLTGNVNHGCGCFIGVANSNSAIGALFGGNRVTWVDLARDLVLLLVVAAIWFTRSPMLGLDKFWTNTREYWRWYRGKGYLVGSIVLTVFISGGMSALAAVNLVSTENAPLSVAADFGPHAKVKVGQVAPNFTLRTIDGKSISLSQYRGKVVLLEFFAVWCSNCQQEAPIVNRIEHEYPGQKLQVLSVLSSPYGRNYETSNQTDTAPVRAADVTWFEHKYHVVSPILVDPHFSITNEYISQEYPNLIVIDPSGRIRSIHIGPTPYSVLSQSIHAAQHV